MFNSTKAHERLIREGQYRIRMGGRVPKDAVNLAYSYVPPLNPEENVQIADTSGFILENIASENVVDTLMWPNEAFQLEKPNGERFVESRNFLITNIFKENEPLYFMDTLLYPIVDSEGPDENGFYKGASISVVSQTGAKLSDAYKYRILLKETAIPNIYEVSIFTNFQTQPSEDIRVIYSAYTPKGVKPGFSESISPQPAFFRIHDFVNEFGKNNPFGYYQSAGHDMAFSQVYVPSSPIRDLDYRHPIPVVYKLAVTFTSDTGETVRETPELYDEVLNEGSVIPEDLYYYNGFKRLQGKIAKDIYLEHYPEDESLFEDGSVTATFSVIPLSPNMEIYTQPDGQNYVLASTEVDTGKLSLPSVYQPITKDGEQYYVPVYSVRTNDSKQIRVLAPVEKGIYENWYLRVKNGRFERVGSSASGFPITLRYSIPEYYKQNFDSVYGMPYQKVESESPEIVGERKIKVRYTPLFIRPDNVSVKVNGIDAVVKGWSVTEGIIEVDTQVKRSDKIEVTYYYEESAYTYRGYWDEANQKFWHLDLNPSHGHTYTDINEDTGEIREVPTFSLINKTIYFYIKPSMRFSESKEMVRGSYQDHVLYHSFEEVNDGSSILLAKIHVRPNSALESVMITDTRKRGGGLKEQIGASLMRELNPESEFYWDIGHWDGDPYSENGVIVVKLPSYILEEHGGRFKRSEVEAIVKRHVGLGILFIIDYINEQDRILTAPWNAAASIVEI